VGRRPSPGRRLGQLISEYRSAAGLSQRDLACAAAVALGVLRDLEQGRTGHPRWGSVEALAVALGLDPGQRAQLMRVWITDSGRGPARPPGPAGIRPAGQADTVQVAVLGPLRATRGDQVIELGPPRQRAVLGLLALRGGHLTRQGELTDLLWCDEPPATAATILQNYLSRLRRLLQPVPDVSGRRALLAWDGEGYRLRTENGCQLDHAAFRQLAAEARGAAAQGQHGQACELYERALRLWRGYPLDDVELLHQHPLATELTELQADAVIRLAGSAAQAGADDQVIPHLRSLCARNGLNEQAVGCLMAALAATGQRAAAMAEFEQLEHRLRRELGVRPDPGLIRVYDQLTGRARGSRLFPCRAGPSAGGRRPPGLRQLRGRQRWVAELGEQGTDPAAQRAGQPARWDNGPRPGHIAAGHRLFRGRAG
jgi:DNA-binding SARP family transcriptional activator